MYTPGSTSQSPRQRHSKLIRLGVEILAVAIIYGLLGKLGQLLAITPGNVTAVWPPSGFALGMVLLSGRRVWAGIWLGAFIVNTLPLFEGATVEAAVVSIAVGVSIGVGTVAQALLGAVLIRRFVSTDDLFGTVRGFLIFVGVIPAMCLTSSTIGATSLLLGGFVDIVNVAELWVTWWLGDGVGVLVITPLVLVWRTVPDLPSKVGDWVKPALGIVLLVVSALVGFGTMYGGMGASHSLEFLTWPFLLWLALQFGVRATTAGILLMAGISIWQTTQGHGPFQLDTPNLSLLLLQLFVTVTAITMMVVSALAAESRSMMNALVAAKVDAERANRAKSAFLSSVSHELRTPLNAILGFAQLLKSGKNNPLSDRQKKQVEHISHGGRRLLKLIDGILDLIKIDTGELSLSVEFVEGRILVDGCLSAVKTIAAKRGIVIEDRTGDSMPAVRTDSLRFRQALDNLLSNAVKFNHEGGSVWLDAELRDERTLRIGVTDTGPGIPEDKQSDLFQPFNRLDAEKSAIEGAGIGLVLTRRLVEEMGGTVGFRSTPGEGSTFWIDFPVAGEEPIAASAEDQE